MAKRDSFPCRLCCPELSTLSHSSLLGHREDLKSASFWVGRFFFFCLIPRKEVRPHTHLVREKVCFPSGTTAPSRPWVFGFLIRSER